MILSFVITRNWVRRSCLVKFYTIVLPILTSAYYILYSGLLEEDIFISLMNTFGEEEKREGRNVDPEI